MLFTDLFWGFYHIVVISTPVNTQQPGPSWSLFALQGSSGPSSNYSLGLSLWKIGYSQLKSSLSYTQILGPRMLSLDILTHVCGYMDLFLNESSLSAITPNLKGLSKPTQSGQNLDKQASIHRYTQKVPLIV